MQSAQIDVRGCVLSIQFKNSLISCNRLSLGMRIFFERDALREERGNVGGNWPGFDYRSSAAGDYFLAGRKIEHELPGDRLQQPAFMTESHTMPGAKRTRFEQRIFHSRNLLLHGIERAPYHRGPDFASAKITNFLDLYEVKKGIALSGGYQFSFFPSCQLTRREPKN